VHTRREHAQQNRKLAQPFTDADAAHLALQAAITADGGSALQKFSAGELSGDSEIGKLVN